MKVTKIKEELRAMNVQQLQDKLEQLRSQLFSLELNAKTSHVKNNSEFKRLRKDIARTQTFITQASQSVGAEV